jgi:starch synthase
MKVLYCTSEARPFAATGGLADVAGSLPQALRLRLIGCRVVMPLYEDIPQELRDNMKFITSLSVPVAWRRQYCGIFEARSGGVIYYLIDNQYYFKRHGLYGHFDDAERFAFLSRAAIEMLPYIDFKPDVIHCNDWQTALIPTYFTAFYANNEWYKGIQTVLTIHNIQYQGKYGKELVEDVLGIPQSNLPLLEYGDCINLLKGGIECANRVTTVSPTYAKEILDPWFSHELDGILKEREWKLSGILNGIDTVSYDPQNDSDIFAPYSCEDLTGRAENKRCLQEQLGLQQDAQVPLIGMVTRMVSHKGLDLVKESLDQLMRENNVQFVILGSGDWEYENFFREMQNQYPGRLCACFGFLPELSRKIYAGTDMLLMPSKSEPCGLAQMIALRYGCIPIVRETGGLKDSIQDSGDGEGNGFTFQSYNAGDMLYAVRRALEGYANPEGWKILVERAMKCDFSWGRSANEYIRLYREMVKENKP